MIPSVKEVNRVAETFRTYIQALVDRHGTAGTIARAIGMSLSAFSRGVRIEGTLGVDKCLKLAEWAGDPPSRVLRLANKSEVADIIERLYGPERAPASGPERELVGLWRDTELEAQKAVCTLLRALVHAKHQQHRPRRRA